MSLTPQQCEDFWKLADKNGDGKLTVYELYAALKQYDPNVTEKDCTTMFMGLDHDSNKEISKAEFMREMAEKPKRSQQLMELFKKYDADGNGTLNKDEIRRLVCDCFKPEVVDEVVKKFIEFSDSSGDGLVSFDEFRAFFG